MDDAIAILMALACPGLDIIGLTSVGGNVPLARTTRNALALLEYAGRGDIPVARGSARPLRGRYNYASGVHGASGLSRRLPNPQTGPATASAVHFLATQLRDYSRRIIVIALGPLTNLARLMQTHSEALSGAAKLVVMGGAVNVPGNVTSHAEFNFYSDPEAARIVLSSGVPLTLVDLAACRQVAISREEAASLRAATSLGTLAAQLLNNWFARDARRQRFEFYDPLALAAALDPAVTTTQQMALTVETGDDERLGATLLTSGPATVAVAQQVDCERFFTLLEDLLGLRIETGQRS